ncbi:hypothetical protein J7K93_11195 [bacterium]|nr:hypothetical protein [bacterium]
MKIVTGTDDKKIIRKKHFGESRFYIVFEIDNSKIVNREIRENITFEGNEHGHGQSGEVMKLLSDCSIFIGRSMGKKSMQNISKKGIKCIISGIEDIEKAVNAYISEDSKSFKYFDVESDSLIRCFDE